jgi:hypothetical protein
MQNAGNQENRITGSGDQDSRESEVKERWNIRYRTPIEGIGTGKEWRMSKCNFVPLCLCALGELLRLRSGRRLWLRTRFEKTKPNTGLRPETLNTKL